MCRHLFNYLLLLFALVVPSVAEAQQDSIVSYLDNDKLPVSQNRATYRRTIVSAEGKWLVHDYLMFNGNLQSVRYYLDDALKIEEGKSIRFYADGSRELEVHYRQNKREGLMEQWYPEGSKMVSAQYSGGKLQGAYSRWHENGRLMAKGSYSDSLMDGDWEWYYENGSPACKERYSRGRLQSINCFDSFGKSVAPPKVLDRPASFPGGEKKMFGFLNDNLQYPETATDAGISGKVIVLFWIEKDGRLSDIQVSTRVHPSLDAEAARVIRSMPAFEPALLHLVPVRIRMKLPIRFALK
jgi:TonB family protein